MRGDARHDRILAQLLDGGVHPNWFARTIGKGPSVELDDDQLDLVAHYREVMRRRELPPATAEVERPMLEAARREDAYQPDFSHDFEEVME